MLVNIDNMSLIDYIPHAKEYKIWKARLNPQQLAAIEKALIVKIQGSEIHTSSWIPGNDWTGTVFDPIYSVACLQNEVSAAQCFGLILWEVLMNHHDYWAFGRYEKDGIPIRGLTYFKVEKP
jgi:hypothetical protein